MKKGTASPLVGIRRIEITDAISKIFEVIKYLGLHYCQTDMVLTELGNESAVNLQFELIRAQKYRELEKEARDNGNYALYRVQTPEWIKSAHGNKRYDPARIASVEWTNDSVG